MTIIYLSGNRITGLSSDSKPTNLQDKAVWYQTDDFKTFDFNLGTTTWTERTAPNVSSKVSIITPVSTTTTTLDFSADQVQTISISENTTFSTSNLAIGKSKTIKITTDGSTRNLAFPSWKFVGTIPTNQKGSKVGILTMMSLGTVDSDIICGYSVEE